MWTFWFGGTALLEFIETCGTGVCLRTRGGVLPHRPLTLNLLQYIHRGDIVISPLASQRSSRSSRRHFNIPCSTFAFRIEPLTSGCGLPKRLSSRLILYPDPRRQRFEACFFVCLETRSPMRRLEIKVDDTRKRRYYRSIRGVLSRPRSQ